MNENWLRWLKISCIKQFEDDDYNFSVNGDQHEDEWDLWCDFYFLSPTIRELNRNYFEITCIIQLVLTDIPNNIDSYRLDKMLGDFLTKFVNLIPIYKYGLTSEDIENDNNILGCLQLQGKIDIQNYGNPQPGTRLSQSTVNAQYRMLLQGET